jgi:hypothetical protein
MYVDILVGDMRRNYGEDQTAIGKSTPQEITDLATFSVGCLVAASSLISRDSTQIRQPLHQPRYDLHLHFRVTRYWDTGLASGCEDR